MSNRLMEALHPQNHWSFHLNRFHTTVSTPSLFLVPGMAQFDITKGVDYQERA